MGQTKNPQDLNAEDAEDTEEGQEQENACES